MIAVLRSLALTILVFFATGIAADDDVPVTPEGSSLFEIEILVFMNTAADAHNAEQADQAAGESLEGPLANAADVQVTVLRPEVLRLGGLRSKVDRLPEHAILLHTGWSQALQDERSARGVQLAPTSASRGLSGTVTTYRGRFLHIALDLTLPTSGGSTTVARLRQSRRVKAGVLHYFDNPAFGAIVVVRPTTTAPT